jgi:hypothetical protein
MGLAANISAIEAKQAINMARAIALSFGDETAARSLYMAAYHDRSIAERVVAELQHHKAVASCPR